MNFYTFFGNETPRFEFPRRVYACLDSTEPDDYLSSEEFFAFFEAIDGDYLDHQNIEKKGIKAGVLDKSVSVLEILCDKNTKDRLFPFKRQDSNTSWLEFIFSEDGDIPVKQYPNLFSEPRICKATVNPVSSEKAKRLKKTFSMDDFTDADEHELAEALQLYPIAKGAAVYDVGQGNCNAIVSEAASPLLYFDFGGGVLANTSTYPSNLSFCFFRNPTIVLSHWDWDHWSSAQRTRCGVADEHAISTSWIVPRQNLGPVHRGFLAKLQDILVWPDALSCLNIRNITVWKCNGPPSNRNHSGLAMVFKPSWAQANGILFTGDSDYKYIRAISTNSVEFDGIVVPHHGGKIGNNTTLPSPPQNNSYHRYCVSFGHGNKYGHPNEQSLAKYSQYGWAVQNEILTQNKNKPLSNNPGHIWINSDMNPRTDIPRNPSCNLRNCSLRLIKG